LGLLLVLLIDQCCVLVIGIYNDIDIDVDVDVDVYIVDVNMCIIYLDVCVYVRYCVRAYDAYDEFTMRTMPSLSVRCACVRPCVR
jgi:hypothetical protein